MGEITTFDRLSYQKPLRNMMLSLWMDGGGGEGEGNNWLGEGE